MSGLNILFLERSLGRGGAQRQLVALAIGLVQRGHGVTVALFYDEGPLIRDLCGSGVVPAGFRAAGVSAGIKESGSPDVGVIVCDDGGTLIASHAWRLRVANQIETVNRFAVAPRGGKTLGAAASILNGLRD